MAQLPSNSNSLTCLLRFSDTGSCTRALHFCLGMVLAPKAARFTCANPGFDLHHHCHKPPSCKLLIYPRSPKPRLPPQTFNYKPALRIIIGVVQAKSLQLAEYNSINMPLALSKHD